MTMTIRPQDDLFSTAPAEEPPQTALVEPSSVPPDKVTIEKIEALMARCSELDDQRYDTYQELEAALKAAGLEQYEGAGYRARFQPMVRRDGTPAPSRLIVRECG